MKLEQAPNYNNGFALAPQNAIVNVTYKSDTPSMAGQSCKPFIKNENHNLIFGGGKSFVFDEITF